MRDKEKRDSVLWREQDERERDSAAVRSREFSDHWEEHGWLYWAGGLALILHFGPIWLPGLLLTYGVLSFKTKRDQVSDICWHSRSRNPAPHWGTWDRAIDELRSRFRPVRIFGGGVLLIAGIRIVSMVVPAVLNFAFGHEAGGDFLSILLWVAYAIFGGWLAIHAPDILCRPFKAARNGENI